LEEDWPYMNFYTILILVFLLFVFNQEGFSQESEMIQDSYMHFPVGEKYFHYKTNPPLVLVEEVQNRCWFTATFVSHESQGEVNFRFPEDMVWPGASANGTFFLISYQTTDFADEKFFQKMVPQHYENQLILNFEIKIGVSQLLVNSTNYFESDETTPKICRPLFDNPPNSIYYYDKIFSPRIQQDYANTFGFSYDMVMCKPGKEMITKIDGKLACVSLETREKLIQRGWAMSNFESV